MITSLCSVPRSKWKSKISYSGPTVTAILWKVSIYSRLRSQQFQCLDAQRIRHWSSELDIWEEIIEFFMRISSSMPFLHDRSSEREIVSCQSN
jgi:hypothetical protein